MHGLEALSAAASGDHYSFRASSLPPVPNSLQNQISIGANDAAEARPPTDPNPLSMVSLVSPPSSMSSSNNINFILNPSPSATSPPIDPNLLSPFEQRASSYARTSPSLRRETWGKGAEGSVGDHEIGFLLRHFSEAPGQWLEFVPVLSQEDTNPLRMDLFDLGSYFASRVPVRALSYPLLKYAACAYAAKQLGQVKGNKAIVGGVCSKQANMELFSDVNQLDWNYKGAKYYDQAILLLMKALQDERDGFHLDCSDLPGFEQSTEANEEDDDNRRKRRRLSSDYFSSTKSDELLAATAILCVYEFLDGSSAAWSRHLNGTKSLLDIAEVGMKPFRSPASTSPLHSQYRSRLSRARKATFWNFVRQDFLAACKLHLLFCYRWIKS